MIVLTFLTVCQALRWSQTGEPLRKAERKEAKIERKLENSQVRIKESRGSKSSDSIREAFAWSHVLPFNGGEPQRRSHGRSKCSLRSEKQKKCCDNTELCPGCDPFLLAKGFSYEEQVGNRWKGWRVENDADWEYPDYCHCSSSNG